MSDDDLDCTRCHNSMYLGDGMERPGHGLCWPCASVVVEEQEQTIEDLRGRLAKAKGAVELLSCDCKAADPEYPHDCTRCEALRDLDATPVSAGEGNK